MKKLLAHAVLAGAMLAAVNTQAQTATNPLNVTATVEAACSFTTAPADLAFGTYNPTQPTASTATASMGITCVTGFPYTIGLNNGLNAVGSQRRMNDGSTGFLEYSITRPDATNIANSGLPWRNSSPDLISRVGTGGEVTFTAFGTLPVGGNNATAPAGAYTDTVTVTITF